MAGDAAAVGEIEYGRDFQISVFGRHVGKVGLVLFEDLVTILVDSTGNIESHVKSCTLSKRLSKLGPSALVAVLEQGLNQVLRGRQVTPVARSAGQLRCLDFV